ncbi:hypothetical protein FZD47_20390 [Bacillus infantis]|uniref:Beta-ketoacyl synthase N-terminal domain-containing protein n=1 Tax=Bacillus infantis TaxID=324767 RepID=A0A5D4SD29_9BACI|nr:hypothetical protein [Bacillus infantis]TYS60571.1 hypothetical protein FZD47_20390 [Bacillus infantis]
MNVYLTGYEVITPWGIGEEAFSFEKMKRDNLKALPPINSEKLGWKNMNEFSDSTKLCLTAIGEALKKAKFKLPFVEKEAINTGIVVGTNLTNLESLIRTSGLAQDYKKESIIAHTPVSMIGSYASIHFNIGGSNTTIFDRDMAGPKALLNAMDLLTSKNLERVIVCQCNLFPNTYSRGYNHSFESVVAFILERKVNTDPDLSRIEVEYTGLGPTYNFDSQDSVNFLLAMLLNERKLIKYNTNKTQLTCEMNMNHILRVRILKEKHKINNFN